MSVVICGAIVGVRHYRALSASSLSHLRCPTCRVQDTPTSRKRKMEAVEIELGDDEENPICLDDD